MDENGNIQSYSQFPSLNTIDINLDDDISNTENVNSYTSSRQPSYRSSRQPSYRSSVASSPVRYTFYQNSNTSSLNPSRNTSPIRHRPPQARYTSPVRESAQPYYRASRQVARQNFDSFASFINSIDDVPAPQPERNTTQDTYEEDSDDFENIISNGNSLSQINDLTVCPNMDSITLEPYDIHSLDITTVYSLNTNTNKFTGGFCLSKSEMKDYLKAQNLNRPQLISTIWKGGNSTGLGGAPTCNFVIKLPPYNIWITLGSFDRIMNEPIRNWYLLPLFGGKRRRIGYKYGVGNNHGSVPGVFIFKAFTKQEIKSNISVETDKDDFPICDPGEYLSNVSDREHLIKQIIERYVGQVLLDSYNEEQDF